MKIFKEYVVHYFPPEPHRYAYHITHSWLWAHFILWKIKRAGYKEAYIES